jgi:predicted exporter
MLALVLLFCVLAAPRMRVETSIFALLPADQRDAGAERALNAYTDQLSRQSMFLVGAPHFDDARAAAARFAETLKASGQFSQVRLQLDRRLAEAAQAYVPYRDYLLSARDREWLSHGQQQRLYDEALYALYTPSGFLRPFTVAQDPLGLLSGFITELRPPTGKARLEQGVLRVDGDGRSYVLVTAQTAASAFSVAAEEAAGQAIAQARAAARAAGADDVIGSGVIQHAADAVAKSKREMTVFTSLSLIGTVVLMLFTFRSPRPLLLTALAMGLGSIAGLLACQWTFGQIHLVTLVFGSSLIGTSVDYAIYFFADRFRDVSEWRADQAPRFVASGIALGYFTTALSYLALLLAPFPGLRQIALFSAVGLGVACGSVLFLMPRLARRWPLSQDASVFGFIRRLAALPRLTSPRLKWVLVLIGVSFVGLGLPRLVFVDDVRALQNSPPELMRQEARARELLGLSPDRRFLLVRGSSPEQVLEREEALRARLAPLLLDGRLDNLMMMSDAVPSARTQAADHALLADKIYAADGLLPRLMRQLGYDDGTIQTRTKAFEAGAAPLAVDAFLANPASDPYRPLWLGKVGDGYAGAVSLFGLHDPKTLADAISDLPGVRLIDKLADISEVLSHYRRIAMLLTAGVYFVICVLLIRRYGFVAGVETCVPPVGGGLLALAVLAWAGVPVNLFHVLALLLVMGMGSDYTIFLREARGDEGPVLLAVVLATLTAVLSFGLLAFSSTPFIHAIGLMQALGIAFAVILALILRPLRREAGPGTSSVSLA